MSAIQTRFPGTTSPAEFDDEVEYAPNEDCTAGSEGAGRLIGLGEPASARTDHPVGPTEPRRASLLTWTIALALVVVVVILTLGVMGSLHQPQPRRLNPTSANPISAASTAETA